MILLVGFLLAGLTLLTFIASQANTRDMHWAVKAVLLPWEVLGLLLDIFLWNVLVATFVFLEPPFHEWTFSARIRRHAHHGHGYRKRVAKWVCENILRPIDPEHC